VVVSSTIVLVVTAGCVELAVDWGVDVVVVVVIVGGSTVRETSDARSTDVNSARSREGLAKTPWCGEHVKYLRPETVPSFLPTGKSSSTPQRGSPCLA
jgi:hypothetical protein